MATSKPDQALVAAFAESRGIQVSPTWTGVDALLPLLTMLADEGLVVLLKIDGQRSLGSRVTAMVTVPGGEDSEWYRLDTAQVDDALAGALARYIRATSAGE